MASESPIHNQKLGYAAVPGSSHAGRENFATGPPEIPPPQPKAMSPRTLTRLHTGREKFATGPFVVRRWIEPGFPGSSIAQYNDVVAGNYKKLG